MPRSHRGRRIGAVTHTLCWGDPMIRLFGNHREGIGKLMCHKLTQIRPDYTYAIAVYCQGICGWGECLGVFFPAAVAHRGRSAEALTLAPLDKSRIICDRCYQALLDNGHHHCERWTQGAVGFATWAWCWAKSFFNSSAAAALDLRSRSKAVLLRKSRLRLADSNKSISSRMRGPAGVPMTG